MRRGAAARSSADRDAPAHAPSAARCSVGSSGNPDDANRPAPSPPFFRPRRRRKKDKGAKVGAEEAAEAAEVDPCRRKKC